MWFKRHWSTVLLLIILLAGLGLLGYPTFADWWNSFHQSRAIAGYSEQVSKIDDAEYEKMLEDAREYNKTLLEKEDAEQQPRGDDDQKGKQSPRREYVCAGGIGCQNGFCSSSAQGQR